MEYSGTRFYPNGTLLLPNGTATEGTVYWGVLDPRWTGLYLNSDTGYLCVNQVPRKHCQTEIYILEYEGFGGFMKQRIATDHHLNPEVKRFYEVKQPLYSSSRAQTAFTGPFSITKKDNIEI